jgi:hypothetical protein
MDQDIAIRLASTVVPEVSVEQAWAIVAEFLTRLVVCGMCGGVGKFTAGHGFTYPTPAELRSYTGNGVTIAAGSEWDCPQCGAHDRDQAVGKDPRFFAWLCLVGDTEYTCRAEQRRPDVKHPRHGDCGYRLMLPLSFLDAAQ